MEEINHHLKDFFGVKSHLMNNTEFDVFKNVFVKSSKEDIIGLNLYKIGENSDYTKKILP